MKYLAALILWLALAAPAHAQLTVPQGGTGTTTVPAGWFVTGSSAIRLTAKQFISLLTDITGTLGVGNGGTGATSHTAGNLLYGSGTGALQSVATTSVSCSGSVSCSTFTALGASPISITASASASPIATSSVPTVGHLAYWTGNGTPSTLSSIATSTATCTSASGITCTNFAFVGSGGSTLALSAIPNSSLANSTISGIALGNNLANLTATDSTLTFSGAYNGGTARTIGINLANANTWTGATTFTATTTHATSTFARIGIGTTTPQWPLQVSSASGPQLTLSDAALTTAPFNFRAASNLLTISTSSPSTFATTTTNIVQFDSSTGSTTVQKLDKVGTATSTFAGGINVTSGCYAVNGTCVGGSASSDTSVFTYVNAVTALTTSWVSISFQVEDFDTSTMHDNATNNSRITIPTSGKYHVGGCVAVASNSIAGARIRLNGTTVLSRQMQGNSNNGEGACVTTIYNFSATDYIELQGAASSVNTTSDRLTNFWAFKID